VATAARQILSDRADLLDALEKSGIEAPDTKATLASSAALSLRLSKDADAGACLVELIDGVELRDDGISVTLGVQVPCSRAGVRTINLLKLSRVLPLKMKRRGVEARVIIASGEEATRQIDPALLKAVARGRAWFDELASGRVRSFGETAQRESVTRRYVERLSRLAFASPAIVEAICQGHQPADLTAETLLKRIDLPLEWSAQREVLSVS